MGAVTSIGPLIRCSGKLWGEVAARKTVEEEAGTMRQYRGICKSYFSILFHSLLPFLIPLSYYSDLLYLFIDY